MLKIQVVVVVKAVWGIFNNTDNLYLQVNTLLVIYKSRDYSINFNNFNVFQSKATWARFESRQCSFRDWLASAEKLFPKFVETRKRKSKFRKSGPEINTSFSRYTEHKTKSKLRSTSCRRSWKDSDLEWSTNVWNRLTDFLIICKFG